MMEEMADAFIMTPGSIGTFEEFFEILTLKQVNQTAKPLTVLDTNGYFEPMMAMLENAVEQKFIDSYVFDLFRVFVTPAEVVDWLETL